MQIRETTVDDLGHVNAVCDASDRARWTKELIAPNNDRVVFVAVTAGEVVGAAKTHFHPDPEGRAPAGHYLGGVVVAPGFRLRGVGSALTQARMDLVSGFERLLFRERVQHGIHQNAQGAGLPGRRPIRRDSPRDS
ncbi:GNAT family N-acetyltransferase [Arthrobacter methylotrophus]|uniref:GNAT family N-acetyltransferase n=1 Tax=Arthrobacter methylotrophus TaxID=121291 RepID=A0ABV5UVT5_9MICC